MQTIIVIVTVVAALFFAVRRLVRILKRKEGCSCGCDHCPMKDGKDCHCTTRLPDIKV